MCNLTPKHCIAKAHASANNHRMTQTTDTLSGWLALSLSNGPSTRLKHRLLKHFGSPKAILQAGRSVLKKHRLSDNALDSLTAPNQTLIETQLAWSAHADHHLIPFDDARYPRLLKEIPDPPLVLYIKGDPAILHLPQIAIVGSRNPTHTGAEIAHKFAHDLSGVGFTLTSGLALGIDAATHRGALAAGGQTIGVLGSGLEKVYPFRHRTLASTMLERGALVSEFPIHAPPERYNFPLRNRIISGLSFGTLVVEATIKSGSLITARQANEQGREVFAIPGSIRNPLASGCHHLLKAGATLVDCIDDIILNIPQFIAANRTWLQLPPQHRKNTREKTPLDPAHRRLLDCVGFETTSVNQLIERSELPAHRVSAMLLILELHGYISPSPGGYGRVKS